MTVEWWRDAEVFYEAWIIILVSLIVLLTIVLFFLLTYAKKENRLKIVLVIISIVAIIGGLGLNGHLKYQPYLEQARYDNALIRDREPKFHAYTAYSKAEQAAYAQLNYIDSLRNMVLYEEERVIEPLTYLGRGANTHYFEHSNGDLFRHNRQIQFTETTEQAQLVGSRFALKDEAFEEIGFKNPENIMYDYIEIPLSEEGKTYEPKDERQFQRANKVLRGWNFRP